LPADDPLLRHLESGSGPADVAPVAARGMKHSLRQYRPATLTVVSGQDATATAQAAMRAKYGWRWTLDRLSQSIGRRFRPRRGPEVIVRIELT
jgi:hypothetical protein